MLVKNLKAYLANIGMEPREFSDLIGYDRRYFNNILNGRAKAGRRLTELVEELTDGVVKLRDFPPRKVPKRPSKKKTREQKISQE